MQQANAVVSGSLSAVAQRDGVGLAESFLSCDAMILIDVSGSMMTPDSRGGKTRYEVALAELAELQKRLPGKLAVVAFSDTALFCPGGQPPLLGSGTNMAGALRFAKVADVPGVQFILISDGYPDSADDTMTVARTYANRIDTIYVGAERSPEGREFLVRLALASGGQSVTADRAQLLAQSAAQLLLGA